MAIDPLTHRPGRAEPGPAAGQVAIEDLAARRGLSDRAKVAEASRQFEAALLRQILSEARKPVFRSSFNQSSAVSGIYDSMVVTQMADSISRSGEFGLARSLQQQLNRPGDPSPAPEAGTTEHSAGPAGAGPSRDKPLS